jgi:hypothetical protein
MRIKSEFVQDMSRTIETVVALPMNRQSTGGNYWLGLFSPHMLDTACSTCISKRAGCSVSQRYDAEPSSKGARCAALMLVHLNFMPGYLERGSGEGPAREKLNRV